LGLSIIGRGFSFPAGTTLFLYQIFSARLEVMISTNADACAFKTASTCTTRRGIPEILTGRVMA
jgi:hypothetical protein